MTTRTLQDWLPQYPSLGPPLPRFLSIYWPWLKGGLIPTEPGEEPEVPQEPGEEPEVPEEPGEEPPAEMIIEYPDINVLSINGIGFKEIWTDGDGVLGARLVKPIVQPSLRPFTVKMYNKKITLYSDNDYRDFFLFAGFAAIAGQTGPSFQDTAHVSLQTAPEGYYRLRTPPFAFQVTPTRVVVGDGSWKPGKYSAEFRLGGVYYDIGIGAVLHRFRVYDFIEVTSSGSASRS